MSRLQLHLPLLGLKLQAFACNGTICDAFPSGMTCNLRRRSKAIDSMVQALFYDT